MELEHPIIAAKKGHTNLLITAGGRLVCTRCTAKSKRTGEQCGRPALKVSKTQKCQFHGGRGNSGPKTPEGKARALAAHTKTGDCSKAARDADAGVSARLLRLEDAMHVLGMSKATRTRGRKPSCYVQVKDVAGVTQMMIDDVLHRVDGPAVD
jgi:hypothetical protein